MNNIVWDGKNIRIGTKIICFDHDIIEVEEFDNVILVVTAPEGENYDNMYGIVEKTGKMWRIQSLKKMYPQMQQTPYVGINISNGRVIVIDFCGCCFYVSPEDGSILGRAGFTK